MKFIIISFFLLLLQGRAYAEGDKLLGLFIEPGITYETGNWNANFPSPFNSTTGTTSGFGLEVKAGLHFAEILFAGVDVMGSQPNFNNPPNNYQSTATETVIGVIGGVQIPITGLRTWAGYLTSGTLDPGPSNGTDFKFQNGTGYKLGLGFEFTHVSLNVEYISMYYPQTLLQALGSFSTNANLSNTTLTNSSFVFSLSLPFGI